MMALARPRIITVRRRTDEGGKESRTVKGCMIYHTPPVFMWSNFYKLPFCLAISFCHTLGVRRKKRRGGYLGNESQSPSMTDCGGEGHVLCV